MSFLTTTAHLHNPTPLPAEIPRDLALSHIHNHDLLIRLDPELASYDQIASSNPSNPRTKTYKITDTMHTLPKGLWDTTVSFEADIIDLDDGTGIEWVIRAPLGLRQRSTWRIISKEELRKQEEEKGVTVEKDRGEADWWLVENVEITANRLLVGTVRGKCEGSWRGIHGRFVEGLREAVEKGGEGEGERK